VKEVPVLPEYEMISPPTANTPVEVKVEASATLMVTVEY
jgi:hypothetical protein